jgi:uncharacterized protein (DUF1697 family)
MDTWIALLRGINVVGRNKVPMKDLAALLSGAGFARVRTYIQSGNVVFASARGSAPAHSARIERLVLGQFGFAPRVLVISAGQLAAAVQANPFPGAHQDHKRLHLYFLSEPPSKPQVESLLRVQSGRDAFELKGSVLYLYTPDGFPDSVLRRKVDASIGLMATARNWRTANELLRLAAAGA